MRPRSPIERMVDEACGITWEDLPPPPPPKDPVTLVCTGCRAELVVERERDFFDFDRIETTCPACTSSARAPAAPKPSSSDG